MSMEKKRLRKIEYAKGEGDNQKPQSERYKIQ